MYDLVQGGALAGKGAGSPAPSARVAAGPGPPGAGVGCGYSRLQKPHGHNIHAERYTEVKKMYNNKQNHTHREGKVELIK